MWKSAAAAAALGLAGQASALEARCAWDNLTPRTREALMAAYRAHGTAPFAHVEPSKADGDRVLAACGPAAATEDGMSALRMYVDEQGAAAWLTEHRRISAETLDAAWEAVAVEDRRLILETAVAWIEDGGKADPAFPAYDRLNASLGLTDDEGRLQGFIWAHARALRLVYEFKTRPADERKS